MTLICIISTFLLGTFSVEVSVLLFVFSLIGFNLGSVVYDALLVSVSNEENRGKISGLGVVYTKEEAEEIYEWIFKNDLWILSDELYEHLVYEGETSPSPAKYDPDLKNTIIVNGVSKSYSMTGWRVGWLIGNKSVIGLGKKYSHRLPQMFLMCRN